MCVVCVYVCVVCVYVCVVCARACYPCCACSETSMLSLGIHEPYYWHRVRMIVQQRLVQVLHEDVVIRTVTELITADPL
jgi:hypothetical protein